MLTCRLVTLFALTTLAGPATASAAALAAPDDGWVAWVSWRQDRNEVWMARADGAQPRRLTNTGAGVGLVFWAPDGRWLVYGDEAGRIAAMRPDGSEERTLSKQGSPSFWLHDNSGFVVQENGDYTLVDPETGERTLLFRGADFKHFAGVSFGPNAMTHDNRYVLAGSHLFIDGYTASNGSFKSEYSAVIVDLLDKDKVYFFGTGCWPFTPPSGDLVFHICGAGGGCPTYPDVYRMSMADLLTRSSYQAEVAHPDADWGHEYNPRASTDGKWITYMSSTGCHEGSSCNYDIFIHPIGAAPSQRFRVTDHPATDAYPDMYVGPLWKRDATPRVLATPSRVTFHALGAAVTPAAHTVKIKNAGSGDLGAVQASIDPPVPWLAIETRANSFELKVIRDRGLRAGKNLAQVTVRALGAVGDPTTVPVVVLADDTYPAPAPSPSVAPSDGARPDGGLVAADGSGAALPSTGSREIAGGCHCALTNRTQPGGRGAAMTLVLAVLALGLAWRLRRLCRGA